MEVTDGDIPARPPLKRPALLALAGGLAVIGGLGLLFGLLVRPQDPDGCTIGLYPGLYGDLLAPAHLMAFASLVVLIGWLDAQRRGGRPHRWTVRVLGALTVLVLVSLLWPGLLNLVGLLALVTFIPAGAVGAIVVLVLVVNVQCSQATADVRWQRHAGTVQGVLWVLLGVGLPAVFAGSYIHGAGLFCF